MYLSFVLWSRWYAITVWTNAVIISLWWAKTKNLRPWFSRRSLIYSHTAPIWKTETKTQERKSNFGKWWDFIRYLHVGPSIVFPIFRCCGFKSFQRQSSVIEKDKQTNKKLSCHPAGDVEENIGSVTVLHCPDDSSLPLSLKLSSLSLPGHTFLYFLVCIHSINEAP